MPVTLQCVNENLEVREEVSGFIVPPGATINMDGTALYQGVAALFIVQLYEFPLIYRSINNCINSDPCFYQYRVENSCRIDHVGCCPTGDQCFA